MKKYLNSIWALAACAVAGLCFLYFFTGTSRPTPASAVDGPPSSADRDPKSSSPFVQEYLATASQATDEKNAEKKRAAERAIAEGIAYFKGGATARLEQRIAPLLRELGFPKEVIERAAELLVSAETANSPSQEQIFRDQLRVLLDDDVVAGVLKLEESHYSEARDQQIYAAIKLENGAYTPVEISQIRQSMAKIPSNHQLYNKHLRFNGGITENNVAAMRNAASNAFDAAFAGNSFTVQKHAVLKAAYLKNVVGLFEGILESRARRQRP